MSTATDFIETKTTSELLDMLEVLESTTYDANVAHAIEVVVVKRHDIEDAFDEAYYEVEGATVLSALKAALA